VKNQIGYYATFQVMLEIDTFRSIVHRLRTMGPSLGQVLACQEIRLGLPFLII